MDPIANVKEQREVAARILESQRPSLADAFRLAELVEALDLWRKQGGYDPYKAPAGAWLAR